MKLRALGEAVLTRVMKTNDSKYDNENDSDALKTEREV